MTCTAPLTYPAELAVRDVEPSASPVKVNEPDVAPAGITTAAGLASTIPPGFPVSATEVPFAGAGVLRVTVPFSCLVRPIVLDGRVSRIVGLRTSMVAVASRYPAQTP